MLYFSRVKLKPGLPIKALAKAIPNDMYGDHQTVWQLMQYTADHQQPRDFIFRREQQGSWPLFYILSSRLPQDPQGVWHIDSKPFAPQLANGQRLAFMLRVNPVITRKRSHDKADTKRLRDDIVMREKTLSKTNGTSLSQAALVQQAGPPWLVERANKHGFRVESVAVDNYQQHRFYKPKGRHTVRFSTLDYQGVLNITEPQAFTQMLYEGIGRSKGFGCGLMMIRRV